LITQQFGIPGFKARRIKQILETGQFDVIHYHNVSLVGGPKVLEYGDAIKLYTTHEYWLVCPTHVLFRFNQAACTKPTCLTCQLSYRRPPQLWRWTGMMNRALRHVDAVISPSRFAAEIHARMAQGLSPTVIPMFIPKGSTDGGGPPAAAPVPDTGQPYFLYVGRLEKLKGLQDVIPVFAPDARADLVVVGTGRYEPELKRRAKGNSRIRFLGSLPFDQLRHLYTNATAVIVPSLCYETFGQVVAEAFSLRTPVIARDIGALSELVAMSGGGILYRTEGELRDAIASLSTRPELRAQLGAWGYAACSIHWTEDVHLEQYFALIDRLRQNHSAHVTA
jgi:glycosyltransferase involved in cell wall biosynthesis